MKVSSRKDSVTRRKSGQSKTALFLEIDLDLQLDDPPF